MTRKPISGFKSVLNSIQSANDFSHSSYSVDNCFMCIWKNSVAKLHTMLRHDRLSKTGSTTTCCHPRWPYQQNLSTMLICPGVLDQSSEPPYPLMTGFYSSTCLLVNLPAAFAFPFAFFPTSFFSASSLTLSITSAPRLVPIHRSTRPRRP